MKTRRLRLNTEKVITVFLNGDTILNEKQTKIPFYHNPELLNPQVRKVSINRPLGTWWTPPKLEAKFQIAMTEKKAKLANQLKEIKELHKHIEYLASICEVSKRPRISGVKVEF